MIDYRTITPADVPAVTGFALDALHWAVRDEPLHIDANKVVAAVMYFAITPGHFQVAAFDKGKCVAALAAYVAEMPWFERSEAHVVFCLSTVPGIGIRMIRDLLSWAHSDMRVRRITWLMNDGADRMPHVIKRRFGFSKRETLVWYKG